MAAIKLLNASVTANNVNIEPWLLTGTMLADIALIPEAAKRVNESKSINKNVDGVLHVIPSHNLPNALEITPIRESVRSVKLCVRNNG